MNAKRRKSNKSKKPGDFATMLLVFILLAIVAAIAAYFLMQRSANNQPKPATETEKQQERTSQPERPGTTGTMEKPVAKTALEGVWVSRNDGAMLTFHQDTFSIDIPSVDNHIFLKGTFALNGSQITFSYPVGKSPCQQQKGTYTYKIADGSMNLKVFSDNCAPRKNTLVATWDKFDTQ